MTGAPVFGVVQKMSPPVSLVPLAPFGGWRVAIGANGTAGTGGDIDPAAYEYRSTSRRREDQLAFEGSFLIEVTRARVGLFARAHTVSTPSEVAAPMIAALRQRIEGIRSGTHEPTLPAHLPALPASVAIGEEVVFFLQPVGFHGERNRWIEVEAGGWTVPSPVAARAVEMRVGFRPGTHEAAAISRLLSAGPAHGLERDEVTGEIRRMPVQPGGDAPLRPARERVDLGISLHHWIAAERVPHGRDAGEPFPAAIFQI